MKEHPEKRMEISHDIRQLNAQKIGGEEADMDETETTMLHELLVHFFERKAREANCENR